MTRTALVAAVLGSVFAPAAWSAVSKEIQLLPTRREVLPQSPFGGARWVVVAEDALLARDAAPGFADVRFVNDGGEMLPVASISPRLNDQPFAKPATVPIAWSEGTPGTWVGMVDLGLEPSSPIALEPMGERANLALRIDTGPDGSTWRPLPLAEPFEPVPRKYPERPFFPERWRYEKPERFLRLTFQGGSPGDRLPDSLRVTRWSVEPVPREAVPFRPSGTGFRGRTWETTLEIEAGSRGDSLSRPPTAPASERSVAAIVVRQHTPVALPVIVEARLPHGGWSRAMLVRELGTAGPVDTLLFEPQRTSAVRLRVENADPPNAPFEIVGVEAVPHRWALAPAGAGRIWVAYGDRFLEPRVWGLEDPTGGDPAPGEAILGPPEPNPFYAPPGFGLEWLKRKPAVLAVAMVAVLGLVVLIIVRGAARPRSSPAT